MPAPGGIKAGRAYVELFADDSKLTRGLRRAQARLKAFAAGATQLGRQLLMVSAVMAVPLAVGGKVFADFEQQMAEVSTMLDKPAAHMDAFSAGIRQMQVEFGETSEALAGGLYDILSASVAPAQAMQVLAVSAKAAKAGLSDTAIAADVITTILNSYGLAAEHAADVSDLLFTIVKRGKTKFAELAPSIGLVASTAASAGVGLDELGAVLAVLTRSGVRTDNAVTALNSIISAFLKPTADAVKLAKELGFEMSSAALKSEGLFGVFERISQLPPDAIAKLFPNIRALRGVLPALKNIEGFAEDIEAMAQRAGATEAAYQKMTDTLAHHFAQMKQSIYTALAEIGEAMEGELNKGVKYVQKIAIATAKWVRENRYVILTVAKLAVKLAVAGVALLVIGKAIGMAAAAIGALQIAVKGLGVAFTLLTGNLIALPVIAVVAAVAALVYVIRQATYHTAQLTDKIQELRKAGDEQRRTDQLRMDRLRQLGEKQQLSNNEMEEAKRLSEKLYERYGDLGIRFDNVAGKILNLANAQENLNRAMKAQAIFELEREWLEVRNNIREVKREMDSVWFSQAKIKDLHQKVLDLMDEQFAVRMRLKALREGDISALTGAAKTEGEELEDAIKKEEGEKGFDAKAADMQEKLDERIHQLRIQQIKDEEAQAIKSVIHRYAVERKESEKNLAVQRKLAEILGLEIENIRERFAKKRTEEFNRRAQERADAEKGLDDDIARLKIQVEKEGLDERLALIEHDRKRAMEEAKKLDLDPKRIEEKFDLIRDLALAAGTPQRARAISVRGTFSAAAVRGFGVGSSAMDRTAKATEKTAVNTDKIAKKKPFELVHS